MPDFAYIARDRSGRRITGQLSVANAQAALAELESRQLMPVSVRERSGLGLGGKTKEGRVSTRTLANFYRQLGDLLRSGVPILRALQLIGRGKANPRLAAVVSAISKDVEDGEGLAESFAKHRLMFPNVHIAMVRAGERGGFLEEVLQRLYLFLNKQAEMRSTIISSMIYPAVLLVVGSIIVTVVMVVFVPKFKDMLADLPVPLPTRIVMGTSDFLTQRGLLALVIAVVVVAILSWAWRQRAVRLMWARQSLRIPVLGPLLSNIAVARFCRILGTLLANGIPMLESLKISRESAGNPILEDSIGEAAKTVQAGETLATPLEASGLFDEDVIEVIRIGEAANNLDTVLVSIAETLEARVDRLLTTAIRLLEPLLLLTLGMVLLFIILALVVPLVMLSASV